MLRFRQYIGVLHTLGASEFLGPVAVFNSWL